MRTVLVTGATGAIGSEIARRLLAERDTRVCLLIRSRSPEHLKQRVEDLYRFWNADGNDHRNAARLEAFSGDITEPRLGLDQATWDRLSSEVTHVIHSAGNVKLNRPFAEARQSAVDSAKHVVAFVDSCRTRGSFEKLDYVSTVGVGGLMPGALPERPIVEPRQFRNSYEAAKAEAETFLLHEMERGLSGTIHRPSMVVGDSVTGRIIQFQVFYHLCEFLSGGRTFGIIPHTRGFQLDIVAVDYVARAIQLASIRPDTAGRVFHLCSADQAPTLERLAQRVRTCFAAHGRPIPRLRSIPLPVMRMLVPAAAWCVGPKSRRAIRALPYFLAYLDTPRQFTNAESQAYFASAGLRLPEPERYLEGVLGFYLSQSRGTGDS